MSKEIEEIIECPICTDRLNSPVMTLCGHNFCKECWNQYKSLTKGETCPLCRQITIYSAVPNLLLKKVINLLYPSEGKRKRKRESCSEKKLIQKIYNSLPSKIELPYGYKKYFDMKLEQSDLSDLTLCKCGLIAFERKVRKENQNHGRPFYSCPLGFEGCGFFVWLDGQS